MSKGISLNEEGGLFPRQRPWSAHLLAQKGLYPCNPVKRGGRRSAIRRNLCPVREAAWKLNQPLLGHPEMNKGEEPTVPAKENVCQKYMAESYKNSLLSRVEPAESMASSFIVSPIEAWNEKMRANDEHKVSSWAQDRMTLTVGGISGTAEAANEKLRANKGHSTCERDLMTPPTLGVRSGTPDAVAMCRGDLIGTNVWEYLPSTPTETIVRQQVNEGKEPAMPAKVHGSDNPDQARENMASSVIVSPIEATNEKLRAKEEHSTCEHERMTPTLGVRSGTAEAANEKLRANEEQSISEQERMAPTLGVKSGTPDAVAMCRGAPFLTGNDIWGYFRSKPPEATVRPESAPLRITRSRKRPSSAIKPYCVASGFCKPSTVVRKIRPSRPNSVMSEQCAAPQVKDDDSSEESKSPVRPKSSLL